MTIELVTGPKTGSAVSETAPNNGDGTENAAAEVMESIAAKKKSQNPAESRTSNMHRQAVGGKTIVSEQRISLQGEFVKNFTSAALRHLKS